MYTSANQTSPDKKQSPDIFKYDNALQYLNDYYSFRKTQDESFSYETWSLESGIKSRSYLYLICSGKRAFTDKFIEQYAKHKNFSLEEKDHFLLISYYANATHEVAKKVFKNRILEKHNIQEDVLSPAEAKGLLHDPFNITLQVLTSFKDVEITLPFLCQILEKDSKDIIPNLKKLEELRLVSVGSNSKGESVWKSLIRPFKVKDEFTNKALTTFHHKNLKYAQNKVLEDNILSKYRTIMMSLHENEFQDLAADMEDFLSKMKAKYGSDSLKEKYLFHLNLQTYTVTKKVE